MVPSPHQHTNAAIGVATMGAMKGAYKLAEKSVDAARNVYPQVKKHVSDLSDSVAMTLGFGAKPATVASGVGGASRENAILGTTFAKKAKSETYTTTTNASATSSKAEKIKGVVKKPKGKLAADADRVNKQPYDPRTWESYFEEKYPGAEITSKSLPKANKKNVKLASDKHPTHDIPFNIRGLPIFDKYVVYDTRVHMETAKVYNPKKHKVEATRDLKAKILEGKINKNIFTEQQLKDIMAEKATIKDFRWHHHEDLSRMQLLPEKYHQPTGHVGGMDLWFQGSKK